jgi:hypothetical protein
MGGDAVRNFTPASKFLAFVAAMLFEYSTKRTLNEPPGCCSPPAVKDHGSCDSTGG